MNPHMQGRPDKYYISTCSNNKQSDKPATKKIENSASTNKFYVNIRSVMSKNGKDREK